ncbi:hypothetical protein BDW22DRAFT_430761 [Trametopsis cervina]|nr:hypothetical protein BDW22DRAFT_430761 [Trametopsis cervina]
MSVSVQQTWSKLLPAVEDELLSSATNGTFTDTVYYLYSQRLKNGKISKPRPVYANSRVMRATASYFIAQLSGEFSTSHKISAETQHYEYDSDSDLDDFDGDLDGLNSDNTPLENVWDGMEGKGKEIARNASMNPNETERSETTAESSQSTAMDIKYQIFIPDVAARTWQALVVWAHTGLLQFAPLKSAGLPAVEQEKSPEQFLTRLPMCSPKPLYRLADIVGMERLKNKAFAELESQVTSRTVTHEMFSNFSSMYRDVLKMQLSFAFSEDTLQTIMPEIMKNIRPIVQGEMPHSEQVLSALLSKLKETTILLASGQFHR